MVHITAFAIVFTWVAFIMLGDPDTARTVVYGVAGWQVGGWSIRIARWAYGKKEVDAESK